MYLHSAVKSSPWCILVRTVTNNPLNSNASFGGDTLLNTLCMVTGTKLTWMLSLKSSLGDMLSSVREEMTLGSGDPAFPRV